MVAVKGLYANQVNKRRSQHIKCSNSPKKGSKRCKADDQPFISRGKDAVGFVGVDTTLAVPVDYFGDGNPGWR